VTGSFFLGRWEFFEASELTFTSFDKRCVRYEELHDNRAEYFETLVAASGVRDGAIVLDVGCGYGACTREVLRRRSGLTRLSIQLIDESGVQLRRAQRELDEWSIDPSVFLDFKLGTFPTSFCNGDMASSFRLGSRFNLVFAKMVLHEVPANMQAGFVRGLSECLLPGGVLVLWDLCLDQDTCCFFRNVIRKKDELAGFDTLVVRRNFLSYDELCTLFSGTDFESFSEVMLIDYELDTRKRLGPELQGDTEILDEWHNYIRQEIRELPPKMRTDIGYKDEGNRITFHVRKGIFRAERR